MKMTDELKGKVMEKLKIKKLYEQKINQTEKLAPTHIHIPHRIGGRVQIMHSKICCACMWWWCCEGGGSGRVGGVSVFTSGLRQHFTPRTPMKQNRGCGCVPEAL